MSIAEQFGSVIKSSANDFINRKLLEEKREELKFIINMRFGPTTWDQILAERAERINKAKEAQRLQRKIKEARTTEIMDCKMGQPGRLCVWQGLRYIHC